MYLNHNDLSKYWVIDIETDDVKATRIWVVVVTNTATGETSHFTDREQFQRFVDANKDCYWIGHNAISFDVPVLNRLWDTAIRLDMVVDTLVLSYLYNPRMPGGHSLEAWGDRLKFPKIDFHDWTKFSADMLTYCVQDVTLTLRVFKALTARMRKVGFSEKSCKIEHDIRVVVDKQERNGFWFNKPEAINLSNRLEQMLADLSEPIQALFPPELVSQGTYKYKVRADGQPYASFERHLTTYPKVELHGDTYEVFDWEEFNIGSPKQRIKRLLSIGYEPTAFTPTGLPKVDEDALLAFAKVSGRPEATAIAEWLVRSGRLSMITTWLNNLGPDQRIHGRVFTCGAGTRRMTHSSPNTANIPKASDKVPFGKECRALWSVADTVNRCLVGYDAAGLEMRMFSHYLGDPAVAQLYIEGDPHQVNADMLGIEREIVKNVFYAFLYGASDGKLTSTAKQGTGRKWGTAARKKLVEGTPGLKQLVERVQYEQSKGFIETIDGGFVRCPSPHAALNYKLQSAGGIVMKVASILLDQTAAHLDHMKVGDIHDEGQHDTARTDAEEFGRLAVQAIRDAGEELRFKFPLDGNYKIGSNWSETH